MTVAETLVNELGEDFLGETNSKYQDHLKNPNEHNFYLKGLNLMKLKNNRSA